MTTETNSEMTSPETATVELTPALLSMRVVAWTDEAVYLRLPLALQRETGGCSCEQCKKNPALAKWDTLVVPTQGKPRGNYSENHSWTCHMPDGAAVENFMAHTKGKRTKEAK
jgi:hypothetical protein